jgi:hypothetical protein
MSLELILILAVGMSATVGVAVVAVMPPASIRINSSDMGTSNVDIDDV